MSESPEHQLIIRGITPTGQAFRPADWAERLAGILSTFSLDSRINYSPYVHPLSYDRLKCLVVDAKLEQIDSRAWDFIMGFARDNDLAIEPFKRQLQSE